MKKASVFRLAVFGASLACLVCILTSCDYWNEDWYRNCGDETHPVDTISNSPAGINDAPANAGKALWGGYLVIDHYDQNSIWRKPWSGELLTADKTYILYADLIWSRNLYTEGRIICNNNGICTWTAGGETYDSNSEEPTEEQMKAATNEAIALSGVTIQWIVEEDTDGVVASIVPSADTRSCAVTIDYSKCKEAMFRGENSRYNAGLSNYSSKVSIKAKIVTTGLSKEYGCWFLGANANRKYFLEGYHPNECEVSAYLYK